jgi:hypothetical protein
MSENFDELLSGLADAAAGASRPRGPVAARKRAKQRTMRRRLAVSTLSVALIVGAAGVAYAAHAPSGVPTPVTNSGSPAPSASGVPISPSPTATSPANGAPTVSLTVPAALAKGTKNLVGFAVTNPGVATTATVTVDLGEPAVLTPNSRSPIEQGTVERQDPGTGNWIAVPVTVSGSLHDVATYNLDLAAQATATQNLRVTPVGVVTATFAVSLSVNGSAPVTQSASVLLTAPTLTATGPTTVTRGTTSGDFQFSLTNATAGDYTGVHLYLTAYGSTAGCPTSVFSTAQWSDGGTWRTVSLSAQWSLLDAVALGHGQTTVISVRLAVPSTVASCLDKGQVALIAETPGGDSSMGDATPPTLAPSFSVRGDSPFFQLK